MHLELSDPERDVLVDVLRQRLGDLRSEIYSTDSPFYKEELKERERLLTAMLERLGVDLGRPPAS